MSYTIQNTATGERAECSTYSTDASPTTTCHYQNGAVQLSPVAFEKAKMIEPRSGDWTEDFEHENGTYQCRCSDCGEMFSGHKRRQICRECHNSRAERWPYSPTKSP